MHNALSEFHWCIILRVIDMDIKHRLAMLAQEHFNDLHDFAIKFQTQTTNE